MQKGAPIFENYVYFSRITFLLTLYTVHVAQNSDSAAASLRRQRTRSTGMNIGKCASDKSNEQHRQVAQSQFGHEGDPFCTHTGRFYFISSRSHTPEATSFPFAVGRTFFGIPSLFSTSIGLCRYLRDTASICSPKVCISITNPDIYWMNEEEGRFLSL